MPSVGQIIGKSEYWLLSSLILKLLKPVYLAPHRPLRVSQRCLYSSRTHLRDHANSPLAERTFGRVIHSENQRKLHQKSAPNDAQVRDQKLMKELDIQSVYHKLRQIALEGNYPQTQACVNILVKERGEKPNLRLYEALLSANADYANGSAYEVARLIEEMEKEGMTPDAAVYHAVLRVLCMLSTIIGSNPYNL